MFIYVEDGGGAQVLNRVEFEKKMKIMVQSARGWYRHEFMQQDQIVPKTDRSINATVYQLKTDDGKK